VGFGTEILFFVVLGALVLGPKRLHTMIGHMARAKARFEETIQSLKSQLAEELDGMQVESRSECSPELSEDN